ncbi:MAG: hypothetical protein FOGNACKC_01968 [Anaerolineae bacterium]|nr:hypothetical protein [Anaerolineae bacterium]
MMTRFVLPVTTVITAVISLVFYDTVARLVVIAGYGVLAIAGTLAIGIGFFGSWILAEKVRMIRARRIEAEKSAHVMVVSDNGQSWVRDTDPRATWRNLTDTPQLYVNGKQTMPADWEIELHRLKLAAMAQTRTAAQVIPGNATLLPEPTIMPLDLLTVFTQPTQAYAIIGGQQTGKTWQARHIATYWVQQGIKPVVIGPKWDKGEWGGCYLIGGGGDMAALEWGITLVRRLVEQRHAAPMAHKSHPIQPIFFDDWTPIVDAVPNARALVLEATTLYASVNVVLYFILHSDTANAWGVDRKGAALKDNFVKLFIQPAYDDTGLILRRQTQGVVRFAGENVDRPVKLFTTPPPALTAPVIIPTPQAEPSQLEAQVLELHRQRASLREISQAVFGDGKFGKYWNDKIKQILNNYGVSSE